MMTNTPSFARLVVEGVDAASFLHGQLANDVRALAEGQWRFGSYCAVDGRVQCSFVLARADTTQFHLYLPESVAAATYARLQMFRMRAKCSLQLQPVWVRDHQDAADLGHLLQGAGLNWRVGAREQEIAPIPEPLWTRQIELGNAWICAATSGLFLPQMLAYAELEAFSLRKGCYPGQEIVARTHYLGRSKRRLAHARIVAASAALPAGLELRADGTPTARSTLLMSNWPASDHCLVVVGEDILSADTLTALSADIEARFVIDRDVSEKKRDGTMNGGLYTPVSA